VLHRYKLSNKLTSILPKAHKRQLRCRFVGTDLDLLDRFGDCSESYGATPPLNNERSPTVSASEPLDVIVHV
jgi:hypothetical protein